MPSKRHWRLTLIVCPRVSLSPSFTRRRLSLDRTHLAGFCEKITFHRQLANLDWSFFIRSSFSASSLRSLPQPKDNSMLRMASCFYRLIRLTLTSYSLNNSLRVFCSLMASNATRALNLLLYFNLLILMLRLSQKYIFIFTFTTCSNFRHHYTKRRERT